MTSMVFLIIVIGIIFLIPICFLYLKRIQSSYIHGLILFPKENKISEDKESDFYVIANSGRAKYTSFARLKRAHIVFTDKRIIVSQKILFSKKYLITHMLYYKIEDGPAFEFKKLSGGLYSIGYQVLLCEKTKISLEIEKEKSFLKIIPSKTKSAVNIQELRIYSDQAKEILRSIID